jgi:hypothetical protein
MSYSSGPKEGSQRYRNVYERFGSNNSSDTAVKWKIGVHLKTKLLAIASILVGLNATSANAEFYSVLKASYFAGVDDFDDEQSFGLTLGYDFNDKHSIEFEAQINGFDSTDPGFEVDADVITYLVNYNYTFWKDGKWQARVGAGAGWAEPEFGVTADKRGDDSIFVYRFGAGVDYFINDRFSATFDVSVQDFDEFSDGDVSYDIGTPGVASIGLRYNF